ncbi:helix-turn-helix transcriptional regulator [Bacillota bacterium LX-D]|nr:helix-turn-helix transcriptional regulator [Bacillota bacterium LX-D]
MRIVEIVKAQGPVTGEEIAGKLNLTRATLRPDLAILTMSGILDARPRVGYYYSGKSTKNLVSEELKSVLVKDIKSIPIVIKSDATVYDAIVTLFIKDVGSLFIVGEQGNLEGVVSRKDLLRYSLGQGDQHKTPVSIVMTRMPNIVMVDPDETVYEAAKKIIEHKVDALPVVRRVEDQGEQEKLEVIGRLTKTNITSLFVELSEGI